MKKKIHIFSVLLFISLLPLSLFTSCDKDTTSYVDVLVVDEGNRAPVPGVKVQLYQHNCDASDYNYAEGITNAEGIFSSQYNAPGIINIRVTLDVENNGWRTGKGSVRLIEGETKTAQITLGSEIFY